VDGPTAEEQADALWWWQPRRNTRREAWIIGGAAVGGGLGVGLATGSVVPALIAAVVLGLLAVPVTRWERSVNARVWAILRRDGQLAWWDTKASVGTIDTASEPVLHLVRVRTRSKTGRYTKVVTRWVVGAGATPRLRGEQEGDQPTGDWAEVAGLRLPEDDEVARTTLVAALDRFTEVRRLDTVLREDLGMRGLTPVATVEGVPD
jgi:hypothetical protein